MSEGFFSRWSRRKDAVRDGKPVEPEPAVPPPAAVEPEVEAAAPAPAPPTLEDVHSLTPQDEFGRFVQADVPADVKNAAMKKLFADPHFNRMDGLDVYIDDYGKPDPLSPEMMKQLVSAKFLGMFKEEEKEEDAPEGREVADKPPAQSVAQSGEEDHADPDLRLQQDHAAGPRGPGPGPG
jgi:hypothetical protein